MTDATAEAPAAAPATAAVPPGWEGLLDEGERILWQGRPSGRVRFLPRHIPQLLFGLFFAGFALFWMTMAAAMGGPRSGEPAVFQLFPLFGLPFLAVGLYMAGGHIFWAAHKRRHTNYTLTTRRGFIATEVMGRRTLESYPLESDPRLEESGAGDTVWFAQKRVATRTKHGTRSHDRPIGFELIEDGRKVYGLIRKARKGEA